MYEKIVMPIVFFRLFTVTWNNENSKHLYWSWLTSVACKIYCIRKIAFSEERRLKRPSSMFWKTFKTKQVMTNKSFSNLFYFSTWILGIIFARKNADIVGAHFRCSSVAIHHQIKMVDRTLPEKFRGNPGAHSLEKK